MMAGAKLDRQLTDAIGDIAPPHGTDTVGGAGPRLLVHGGAYAAGARADAVATADMDEWTRRIRSGTAPLTGSLRLLDALLALPAHGSTHMSALLPAQAQSLRNAPAGVVAIDGDSVERLAQPPVTVLATVTSAPTWRAAFAAAVALRPMARSYILAPAEVDLTEVIWEAQIAGVGVLAPTDDSVVEALPAPDLARPDQLKPARWRFLERVYAAATIAA